MEVAACAKPRVRSVVAADFSRRMLEAGRNKTGVPAVQADALHLPFLGDSFDAVTVGFGLRNVESLKEVLEEVWRVLRPNGIVGVLDTFRPERLAGRLAYKVWIRRVVPRLGARASGAPSAYRYLAESIGAFATVRECEQILAQTGFAPVASRTFWPGIVGIVLARKT